MQSGAALGKGVDGVGVIASALNAVRVGMEKSDFVGGRVEVTKTGAAVGVSCPEEIDMQAVNNRLASKISVQGFFISVLYNGIQDSISQIKFFHILKHHHLSLRLFYRVADNLFLESISVQHWDLCQGAQQTKLDDSPTSQSLAQPGVAILLIG